jgi:hypothetical protein
MLWQFDLEHDNTKPEARFRPLFDASHIRTSHASHIRTSQAPSHMSGSIRIELDGSYLRCKPAWALGQEIRQDEINQGWKSTAAQHEPPLDIRQGCQRKVKRDALAKHHARATCISKSLGW